MLAAREDRLEREHPLLARLGGDWRQIGRHLILVDRARDFPEPALEEPTKLQPEARLVLREGALLRAPTQELGQLAPALAPRVQPGERLQRVGVGLLDVERGPIRLDGLVVVAELCLFEQRDRVERRQALLRPIAPVE